jgi:hypothetical protein
MFHANTKCYLWLFLNFKQLFLLHIQLSQLNIVGVGDLSNEKQKFQKISWFTEQQAIGKLEHGSTFHSKVGLEIIA